MKITTVSTYQYNNKALNPSSVSHKGSFETLNKINPVARKADDYFVRMAKHSTLTFEPIIDSLQNKISQITIKNKKQELLAWDINPNKSNKYILFLHGMAQNITNYQKLYSAILEQNEYGILALEFRGYGLSKDGNVSESNLNSDVKQGFQYLEKEKKINPDNIIVMGHSMGGALAANLASKQSNIKALILICPLSKFDYIGKKFSENTNVGLGIPQKLMKLTNKIKPLKWLYNQKFNTVALIKKIKSPIYLIHSTNDLVTTTAGANRIIEEARENNIPINSFFIERGGHRVDNRKISKVTEILSNLNNN